MINVSATAAIKKRLIDIGMSQIELANQIGITRQNLNNKLTRDNFTTQDLDKICKVLNLKLVAISEDGKEYTIRYQ